MRKKSMMMIAVCVYMCGCAATVLTSNHLPLDAPYVEQTIDGRSVYLAQTTQREIRD